MNSYKRSRLIIFSCLVALLILLLLTSPQHLPAVSLIAPFILIYILLTVLIDMLLRYIRPAIRDNNRQRLGLSAIIAALPTACLVLKSIGQFSVQDLIILILLLVIFSFYLSRSRSK